MAVPVRTLKSGPSVRLALIEFSDFQCPYCGRYARETFEKIKLQLVDAGKLTYSFVHFPLESIHGDAVRAAEGAECAGESGKFWEMHDVLFKNQQALALADLRKSAMALGVTAADFDLCMGGRVRSRVSEGLEEGKRLGVSSTPTFLLGEVQGDGQVLVRRRIRGAATYETFDKAVREIEQRPVAAVQP